MMSLPLSPSALLAVAAFLLLLLGRRIHAHLRLPPLPPGPRPWPVIGNLLHLPKERNYLVYTEWAKQYGEIMSLTILGRPVIVLNSRKAVMAVMEKGAATSAGRPQGVMAHELVGFGRLPTMTNDMHLHRKYRRLYATALNRTACQQYHPLQCREMRRTVLHLLEGAEARPTLGHGVASIISEVVYGRQVSGPEDESLVKAREVLRIFERVIRPGGFLVDFLPILRHLPPYFPGANFQRLAREWKRTASTLREEQVARVQQDIAAGRAKPSYVSNLLSQAQGEKTSPEEYEELVELVQLSAQSFYGAGVDTTFVTLQHLLLALARFPAVQQRAREEVDRIVGRDRLPQVEDRERMPYLQAVIQESLRLSPPVPLGIPHAMLSDDTYGPYRLPKGATIIPNIWNLTRDPSLYPNPTEFKPERYLAPSPSSPGEYKLLEGGREAFGYGRRVCAGRDLAENTIFAFLSTLLWAGEVRPREGWDGEVEYEPGAVYRPKELPCCFVPREGVALDILRGALAD